ncbi:hypothetical protein [Okeania sp. SIO2G5]|uniref:hypothetical protein n=1 Tax=Okeania sp. SIO2G5 TaxID=2607796 RepID=UPI0025797CF9|nr:hypothetical protein [Okeania sp. SIO2G5]
MPKISTTEEETNFSVIRENLPLINSRYFGQVTNKIRDFSARKFCEILPKISTTEEGKKFIDFQNMTNRVRDFFCGKIIYQLIVTI